MEDPSALLATLAQSTAAIVAIVGGFLVSRLVALSSEREGIRRQLQTTRDRLSHARDDYQEAHQYRLENSIRDFTDWMLPELVKANDSAEFEALLTVNVPRGSSEEEMRPVFDELRAQVADTQQRVRAYIQPTDTAALHIDDLLQRGLQIEEHERDVVEQVIDYIAETELPQPSSAFGISIAGLRSTHFIDPDRDTDLRRLDESIRDEQQLAGQLRQLGIDEDRLQRELADIGRPVGVTSAIMILSVYSLVGIVVPLIVMAVDPETLAAWEAVALISLFGAGLVSVLGYVLWYARTLDEVVT